MVAAQPGRGGQLTRGVVVAQFVQERRAPGVRRAAKTASGPAGPVSSEGWPSSPVAGGWVSSGGGRAFTGPL